MIFCTVETESGQLPRYLRTEQRAESKTIWATTTWSRTSCGKEMMAKPKCLIEVFATYHLHICHIAVPSVSYDTYFGATFCTRLHAEPSKVPGNIINNPTEFVSKRNEILPTCKLPDAASRSSRNFATLK